MNTTPIWIYDRDEILRIILHPKTQTEPNQSQQTTQLATSYIGYEDDPPKPQTSIPYRNGWYTEQLNGQVKLTFEVPNNYEGVEWIQGDSRAVIRDQDGNLVEFIIRQAEDRNGWKSVFAEGSDYENIDEVVTGYTQTSVTLKTSAQAVLQNTRWQVGECGEFGTNSVDLVDVTVKNAIHQLTELFGAERRYRVEHTGNQITGRYIDFLTRRGQNTGKRFEEGKDIISYRRNIDTTGIKTALYGRGASQINNGPRLTFADVEWSKANGDPTDKPLGQTWISDADTLQKWGYDKGTRHRWGWYDGQEEDPAVLLLNTWNHLQTLTDSIDTYDFDVMLLQDITGFHHEKVRLGDTISGLVRSIKPKLEVEASIIEYKQNLNDIRLSKVVLGAFRKYFDANIRLRGVENTVNRNQGNWDKKETPQGAQDKADEAESNANTYTETYAERKITRDFVAPSNPKTYDLWIDISSIPPVWKQWDGNSWVKITRSLMSEIGGQITETQIADDSISTPKLKANAVVADKIAANQISTNHISSAGIDAGVITAGTISGVTINVDTDVNVGQNIYLQYAYVNRFNEKGVVFYDGIGFGDSINDTRIVGTYLKLDIICNNAINLKTDTFDIGAQTTRVNGEMWFNSSEPMQSVSETGRCGAGGRDEVGIFSSVDGVDVNFRTKKSYTPSSITLSARSNTAPPNVTDISADGFWFYVEGNGSPGFRYWRGNYTA